MWRTDKMGSSIALFIFIVGIGALFFLDRDNSVRTSKALWLPVIWLWINASRPISAWLGMNALTSNWLDEIVAGILMVLGIIVIGRRRRDVILLLKRSWPVILYFSFCLVSVLWSDLPGQSLQRWVKALGDLIMVMIVASDVQPKAALRRLFSRVGFVLLPTSVLLVKYFPNLGRGYDQWGFQMNTGVTTNKNMLGVSTFVLALGAFWQVLRLLRDREQPNRGRHLLAQSATLCFGISLLFMAHSATSGASFTLGVLLLLITAISWMSRRPTAVHVIVLSILLSTSLAVLLGGTGAAAEALGRDPTLTGRTEIWSEVIPLAPNPIVGSGFESFWSGQRLEKMKSIWGEGVNEAHNGYLEAYLNLGYVGVGLIGLILIQSYWNSVGAFRRDPAVGSLLIAFTITAAIYSITEAGFRMLDPIWFFLLLSVVAASRITSLGNVPLQPVQSGQQSLPLRVQATHEKSADPSFSQTGHVHGRVGASIRAGSPGQTQNTKGSRQL
jgi:exopolysaccharide production protein ExoQ